VGWLALGPHLMGHLQSEARVSASFHSLYSVTTLSTSKPTYFPRE